ncbi:hypothetical protein U2060_15275, partial [Listeria monocytogenes]|uniref:hypothetical protein n=1 Tax=Listeria monocytogenes TaxID=1639 RepID=UPI002FDBAFD6
GSKKKPPSAVDFDLTLQGSLAPALAGGMVIAGFLNDLLKDAAAYAKKQEAQMKAALRQADAYRIQEANAERKAAEDLLTR